MYFQKWNFYRVQTHGNSLLQYKSILTVAPSSFLFQVNIEVWGVFTLSGQDKENYSRLKDTTARQKILTVNQHASVEQAWMDSEHVEQY